MIVRKLLILAMLVAWAWALAAQEFDAQTFTRRIWELTNQARAENGLQPLKRESGLDDLAALHSRNMARDERFDHVDSQGMSVEGRALAYYPEFLQVGIGENLYLIESSKREFDPHRVVQGWLASPGHRANILDTDYTHIGIGICQSGDKLYSTQVFATPLVKILTPLPAKFSPDKEYAVEFEYLSTEPQDEFRCLVATPDPSTQIGIDASTYYEGLMPVTVEWLGARRFRIKLDFRYGPGTYKLQFGWGGFFYPDLYSFTVK